MPFFNMFLALNFGTLSGIPVVRHDGVVSYVHCPLVSCVLLCPVYFGLLPFLSCSLVCSVRMVNPIVSVALHECVADEELIVVWTCSLVPDFDRQLRLVARLLPCTYLLQAALESCSCVLLDGAFRNSVQGCFGLFQVGYTPIFRKMRGAWFD